MYCRVNLYLQKLSIGKCPTDYHEILAEVIMLLPEVIMLLPAVNSGFTKLLVSNVTLTLIRELIQEQPEGYIPTHGEQQTSSKLRLFSFI